MPRPTGSSRRGRAVEYPGDPNQCEHEGSCAAHRPRAAKLEGRYGTQIIGRNEAETQDEHHQRDRPAKCGKVRRRRRPAKEVHVQIDAARYRGSSSDRRGGKLVQALDMGVMGMDSSPTAHFCRHGQQLPGFQQPTAQYGSSPVTSAPTGQVIRRCGATRQHPPASGAHSAAAVPDQNAGTAGRPRSVASAAPLAVRAAAPYGRRPHRPHRFVLGRFRPAGAGLPFVVQPVCVPARPARICSEPSRVFCRSSCLRPVFITPYHCAARPGGHRAEAGARTNEVPEVEEWNARRRLIPCADVMPASGSRSRTCGSRRHLGGFPVW